MCPFPTKQVTPRRGLTLVELLIASSVVAMLMVGMASLAVTVDIGNSHSKNTGLATQHARVAIGRIERAMLTAHATELFPGFASFSETEGGYEFPDTLVVWKSSSLPSDPGGLPLFSELLIYCADPAAPNELVEFAAPTNNNTVPELSDEATWLTELAAIKADPNSTKVRLTDLLRTASISGGTTRGCVRFICTVRPTHEEWTDFKNDDLDWDEIAWAQEIYGSQTGLRQSWCRFELQLMPGEEAVQQPAGKTALPFFGSAAIYYELHK